MAQLADVIKSMSGLDAIRAMIAGEIEGPEMAKTLGFRLIEAAEGLAVFEGAPSARLLNPLGVVHGGFALTLIDSCCGCAGHTTLSAGVGYTTVETKVNFTRPIFPDGDMLRAEGRVVVRGKTIITTEGRLTDAAGKLYAHGTSTLIVLPAR